MSIKVFISQNNISDAWENLFKIFTNSQINLSEAWEHFFKNNKAHRAQKDISEALEQFHSSKNLSEAQRAIPTNHSIILALSDRCVQQGYLWQTKKQNKKRLMLDLDLFES